MYTVDYFIDKFSEIPDQNWTTGIYFYPTNPHKCCALGHCGSKRGLHTLEAAALTAIFKQIRGWPDLVNDGHDTRFTQPHPKQRILATLQMIKTLQ